MTDLTTASVQGDLWLDGSFLTDKIDPEDLDLVLRVHSDFYDNCTPDQRSRIDAVGGNLKASHHCDSYILVEFAVGHPQFSVGEWMKAYWIRQFGFSRGQDMKGIAVVTL